MLSKEALDLMDNAWPFKRVKASKELLDRFNKLSGEQVTLEFAVTVRRDVEVTEQMLWDALVEAKRISKEEKPILFGDGSWDGPVTGITKTRF
jgi:hypothetical protein